MFSEINCFPEDWIGKKLVKVNEGTYHVNGDSNKQVFTPFGEKSVSASWLSNGVLLIDTGRGVKYFLVGTQRHFPAYGNETEPHEKNSYEEAVRECQRLREEEKKRQSYRHNPVDKEETKPKNNKRGFKSGKGSIIGGVGDMIDSAKKAIKDFRSIDDNSFLEEVGSVVFERQQKEMADIYQQAEIEEKRTQSNEARRQKELKKLRKFESKFINREQKKRIFSNLHMIFTNAGDYIPDNLLCQYAGIYDSKSKASVSCVMNGYRQSLNQVGASEKFYQYWSEIIYLIEEGILFENRHVELITKIINNECGQNKSNETENVTSFDSFLKICYPKLSSAYWGYNFEKDPKEDKIKERIDYLENTIFLDEDFEDFDGLDDIEEDEFIDKKKKANGKSASNTKDGDNKKTTMSNSSSKRVSPKGTAIQSKTVKTKTTTSNSSSKRVSPKGTTIQSKPVKTKTTTSNSGSKRVSPKGTAIQSKPVMIILAILIGFIILLSLIFSNSSESNQPNMNASTTEQSIEDKSMNTTIDVATAKQEKPEDLTISESKEFVDENQTTVHGTPIAEKYDFVSERLLTEDDLKGLSKEELKIMRNWIFARHGYKFKTANMQEYFNAQDWYVGVNDDVSSMLSSIEKKNIELIKRYE